MEDKLKDILRHVRSNKTAFTTGNPGNPMTNPKTESNGFHNVGPSRFEIEL